MQAASGFFPGAPRELSVASRGVQRAYSHCPEFCFLLVSRSHEPCSRSTLSTTIQLYTAHHYCSQLTQTQQICSLLPEPDLHGGRDGGTAPSLIPKLGELLAGEYSLQKEVRGGLSSSKLSSRACKVPSRRSPRRRQTSLTLRTRSGHGK